MKKEKRKEEKIKYKVFTLRLHEQTRDKFIKQCKRSDLSWNLFVLKLLEQNESQKKHRN